MQVAGDYRKDFTVLKDFSEAGFTGLTRKVVKPLELALEHTKQIRRFWNDDNVDRTYEDPTLYEHIFTGLATAKNDIFSRIEKLKVAQKKGFKKNLEEFATKFNRAFLVHDFGEMFMEFSTVAGRFNKKEGKKSNKLNKEQRDSIERKIAKLVFNAVEIISPKSFSHFFSDKSKEIATTNKYGKKIDLAKKFLKDGMRLVNSWKQIISADRVAELNDFVDNWMQDFDISQKVSSLKDSFVGNLVKVVDKLEDVWRAADIHDPKKLTDEFKSTLISSYMKAYRRLKECTEAKAMAKDSVEAAVLKQVDRLIKARFEEDNKAIKKTSVFRYKDIDSAYDLAPLLPL